MPLDRAFYANGAPAVAHALLGKCLIHRSLEGTAAGIIVETEAYLGQNDPASHASRGPTPRNSVMFGPAGRAYVYFTYGMHYCFNVVTGPEGVGEAVLIRALEPLEGIELMSQRRLPLKNATSNEKSRTFLCGGPAKLVQALGITKALNGHDLTRMPLTIESAPKQKPFEIVTAPRIGITRAVDLPMRFYVKDNPYVSRPVHQATPPPSSSGLTRGSTNQIVDSRRSLSRTPIRDGNDTK